MPGQIQAKINSIICCKIKSLFHAKANSLIHAKVKFMSSSNHSKMNPFIHTKVNSLFHAKVNSFFHARGQLWKIVFLQRKVTKGEGDHFPAVLIRTYKYSEKPGGKSWLDIVFWEIL